MAGEEPAPNVRCFWLMFRSTRPALPLVSSISVSTITGISAELGLPKRHAMRTFSASFPITSFTTGDVICGSGVKVKGGMGFEGMLPKYLSIKAIASSGLKSPAMMMAMLLGT